jgi:hypothetical protein
VIAIIARAIATIRKRKTSSVIPAAERESPFLLNEIENPTSCEAGFFSKKSLARRARLSSLPRSYYGTIY